MKHGVFNIFRFHLTIYMFCQVMEGRIEQISFEAYFKQFKMFLKFDEQYLTEFDSSTLFF